MRDPLLDMLWERMDIARARVSSHFKASTHAGMAEQGLQTDAVGCPSTVISALETATSTLMEVARSLDHSEAALVKLGREHRARDLTFQEFKEVCSIALANERTTVASAKTELQQWRRLCGVSGSTGLQVASGHSSMLLSPFRRLLESPWCRSPCNSPTRDNGQAEERVRAAWDDYRLGSMRSLALVCDWLQNEVENPRSALSAPFEYTISSSSMTTRATPSDARASSQAVGVEQSYLMGMELVDWVKARLPEDRVTVA